MGVSDAGLQIVAQLAQADEIGPGHIGASFQRRHGHQAADLQSGQSQDLRQRGSQVAGGKAVLRGVARDVDFQQNRQGPCEAGGNLAGRLEQTQTVR